MIFDTRRLTSIAVCVVALLLAVYFVEYRVEPSRMCPGSVDVICDPPDAILGLGLSEIEPAPGSVLARYHGRIGGVRVIAARHGYAPVLAAVMGIVLPTLLILTALLNMRRPEKPT